MAARLGLVFFPAFDWAISPTHPEREERLLYTKDQLFEEGVLDLPGVVEYRARPASFKDVARVHFCVPQVKSLAGEAHLVAAGSAIHLAEAWRRGEIKRGFALVRPPGHHARRIVHGNRGFCNINNEAIMIEYLRRHYGVRRIAIVDTDVHHGDGTQDIYYHDPEVLFISLHQDGRTLYPGTGSVSELGGPGAFGYTLNVPLPPRTNDEGILYVMEELVLPVLADFKPELVVNSAGQDNHYSDPLADMCFSAQGYAHLNELLKPDLCVLEGGYSIEGALPYVNLAIVLALAGYDYSRVREPDYDPSAFPLTPAHREYIRSLVRDLKRIWENREELAWQNRPAGDLAEFRRRVFYDTDGIEEFQEEKVRLCPRCPGYQEISSYALHPDGRRLEVLAISLPLPACEKCQQEAREIYTHHKEKRTPKYAVIYLQDRPADRYYHYYPDQDREEVL
ncbi:histone deacetylase [Ammonifex thiophilus]|uniref:Histone deacetylase n=1 Tax=Ammonifex thiophilus TaxID=444093 RepID=A0A3D8P546_9THEO|nr:histone deacetylase [Ammonifex thiophilus]RDV83567.1 histone deacetylase [Ammonifex thiophilus]